MSSTTRVLVLGVVRLFQPVHGYEVRRELVTWRASEWASIKPGSIYNALKTLTSDGFLEVVGTDQVGGRPERTTYQLTQGGEEEFRHLLREEWWTVRVLTDPLMAAISFLSCVSRDEAIAALEHRTTQIHGIVRHMQFGIEHHDGVESPYHVREMMRLMNARMSAEVAWAEQFIARLRAGEYSTAGDPPWIPASASKAEAARRGKRRPAPAGRPARTGPDATRRSRASNRNGAAAVEPRRNGPATVEPPRRNRPATVEPPRRNRPATVEPPRNRPRVATPRRPGARPRGSSR